MAEQLTGDTRVPAHLMLSALKLLCVNNTGEAGQALAAGHMAMESLGAPCSWEAAAPDTEEQGALETL